VTPVFIIKVGSFEVPPVAAFAANMAVWMADVARAFSQVASGATFPVGFIAIYPGSAAPKGWMVCDGSALPRSGFRALFNVIGEGYGPGDGSTTFNIPTQAQCIITVPATTAPGETTGGSVDPTTPPTVTDPANPTGGTGGNNVVGARPPLIGEPDVREQ
jgi:hypothetical protein